MATLKDFLSERLPTQKMVAILYEGIDLNEFTPSSNGEKIRKNLHIPHTAPVIGSISRLSKTKGQFELIEVAAQVLKEEPRTVFLMVGNGLDGKEDILDKLKTEVRGRGLEQNIHFLGWRDDVQEILAGINIFVQNSLYPEGLGISCLEAMAMGKPTIVTDMGGLCETSIDGLTGFILPPNQPYQLAEAILTAIRDKNLQEEMGNNARRFAEARFDITKGKGYIEQIYLRLIERNRRKGKTFMTHPV